VLYGVDDGRVRVADQATGLQRIPRDEFLEKWRGHAALISHTERFE
jgi:ABC-type bacteriocin/lantibiotic exporter with double-glycine peptidase domain